MGVPRSEMEHATLKPADDAHRLSRIATSIAYCFGFFGLGLVLACLGPSLLAIAVTTGSDLESCAWLFTGRALGYLLGACICGPVIDRARWPNCVLAASLAVAGAATCVQVVVRSLPAIAGLIATQGIAMGFLDSGGNVLLIRTWAPYTCGAWMQTLHFSFAAGAFASP